MEGGGTQTYLISSGVPRLCVALQVPTCSLIRLVQHPIHLICVTAHMCVCVRGGLNRRDAPNMMRGYTCLRFLRPSRRFLPNSRTLLSLFAPATMATPSSGTPLLAAATARGFSLLCLPGWRAVPVRVVLLLSLARRRRGFAPSPHCGAGFECFRSC